MRAAASLASFRTLDLGMLLLRWKFGPIPFLFLVFNLEAHVDGV